MSDITFGIIIICLVLSIGAIFMALNERMDRTKEMRKILDEIVYLHKQIVYLHKELLDNEIILKELLEKERENVKR